MNFKSLAVIGAAVLCFSFSHASTEAAPIVPEDIFRWVQSSARTNYYFNRQQICFDVHKDGTIDTNTLIVPVLKTFDDVMINDVVSKRRWNGKNLQGFDDFVGVSEYLTINLPEKRVYVNEVNYLDSTWTTLAVERSEAEISLEDLSEKSLDARFYDRIIDFALRNQLVLADRTRGDLEADVREKLATAQEEYRAGNRPDRPSDNE